jgi:hypothetical protein
VCKAKQWKKWENNPFSCEPCAEKKGICPNCGEKILQDQEKPDIKKLIDTLWSSNEKERANAAENLKKLSAVSSEQSAKVLEALEKAISQVYERICPCKMEGCPWSPFTLEGDFRKGIKKHMQSIADEIRADFEKQFKELLERLNSDDPKVRDEATSKIIELGKAAKVIVTKSVEEHLKVSKGNAEVESRCKKILEELKKGEISEEDKKWIKTGVCNDTHKAADIERQHTCVRCHKVFSANAAPYKLCSSCASELGGICPVCQRKKE